MTLPSYGGARDVQLVSSYSEGVLKETTSTDTSAILEATIVSTGIGLSNVTYTVYALDGTTPIATAAASGDEGVFVDSTTDTTKSTMTWTFGSTLTAGTYRVYVTADYEDANGVTTAVTGNVYIKVVR